MSKKRQKIEINSIIDRSISNDIIWMKEHLEKCHSYDDIKTTIIQCLNTMKKLYEPHRRPARLNYDYYEVKCCSKGEGKKELGDICNVWFAVKIYFDGKTIVEPKGIKHGSEVNESESLKKSRLSLAKERVKMEIECIGEAEVIKMNTKQISEASSGLSYNTLWKHKDILYSFSLFEYLNQLKSLNNLMIIDHQWEDVKVMQEPMVKRKYERKCIETKSDVDILNELKKRSEPDYVLQLNTDYSEEFCFDNPPIQDNHTEDMKQLKSLSIIFPIIHFLKDGSIAPIIFLDGTFHKSFNSVILTAVTVNADHKELLVGMSISETESCKGWSELLDPSSII